LEGHWNPLQTPSEPSPPQTTPIPTTTTEVELSNASIPDTPPPKKGVKKPGARTIKTVLPDNWTPNEQHYQIAAKEGGRDRDWVDGQAERMRDWAKNRNERGADWDAYFRNWIRRDLEGSSGRRQRAAHGSGFQVQPSTGRVFAPYDDNGQEQRLREEAAAAGQDFTDYCLARIRRIAKEVADQRAAKQAAGGVR